MKNIILIRPDAKSTLRAYPPFGIFYIASVLKNKGYPVKILDMANSDSEEDLIREIKLGPLCVGITSMTGTQLQNALRYAKIVKELDNRIPVILGGVHVSIFPQHSLESQLIDIGVLGEGELTMLELAEAISSGKALHNIDGIAFKENDKVVITKKREFADLKMLPRLDYSLIKIERYVDSSGTFMIHTGRGCCHNCKFCYNNFQGKRHRNFPVETVIDDIKMLKRDYQVNNIKVIDDNIFSNIPFLKAFTNGLIENGLSIGWHANARISEFVRFDKAMLDLIKESGCRSIGFGVESGSQRMLDFIEKKVTLQQIKKMRSILDVYGLSAYFYFLFGLPTEKRDDFVKSLNVMNMLFIDPKNDVLNFYCYVPYPGTELYEYVIKEGLFEPPSTMDGWASLDWNTSLIDSFTKSFDPSLRAVRTVFKMKRPNLIYRMLYFMAFPLLKTGFTLSALNRLAEAKNTVVKLIPRTKQVSRQP